MHLQLVWFCAYVRPYNVNLTADVLFWNGLFLLFLRFIVISILPTAFYMDGPWAATATTGIFLAAAVTDWLDGYLARKVCSNILSEFICWTGLLCHHFRLLLSFPDIVYIQMQLGTPFGAFLDPVADKVLSPSSHYILASV